MHVYISQLRKLLRHPDRPDGPVITQPSGYVLGLGGDDLDSQLDSQVFAREVARGRESLRARRQHARRVHHAADRGQPEGVRGERLGRAPGVGDVERQQPYRDAHGLQGAHAVDSRTPSTRARHSS